MTGAARAAGTHGKDSAMQGTGSNTPHDQAMIDAIQRSLHTNPWDNTTTGPDHHRADCPCHGCETRSEWHRSLSDIPRYAWLSDSALRRVGNTHPTPCRATDSCQNGQTARELDETDPGWRAQADTIGRGVERRTLRSRLSAAILSAANSLMVG